MMNITFLFGPETVKMTRSRLPATLAYGFALCVASVLAYVTTLMLTLGGVDQEQRLIVTLCVFVALIASLAFYVRCCLARGGTGADARRWAPVHGQATQTADR
jgi:hypothetical protein